MASPKKGNILVVDDEPSIRESFSLILEEDFRVETAASGEAAIQKVSSLPIDLVYLDIRMPGMDGMETLRRLKEINKDVEVVMVTAVNDVQSAGEAIQNGARDYIVKPFDVETVLQKAVTLLEKQHLKAETQRIRTLSSHLFQQPQVLGKGRRSDELQNEIRRAAETSQSVLLMGEAGSEFEEVARLIHLESVRSTKPFEAIYFGPASNPSLSRRTLFGHQEGAATSTLKVEPGIIQRARGGSIFLSHVEHLDGTVQNEIVQMLSEDEAPSDVRFIASWVNRMPDDPNDSTLHPTLFEALSAIAIRIPTLSERLADFENIVQDLIDRYRHRHHRPAKQISGAALTLLESYPFKGGMTELKSLVENAVLRCPREQIESDELPLDVWLQSRAGGKIPYPTLVGKYEKAFLERALQTFGKNILTLSKRLGLSPTALQAKLEHYQLQ